MKTPALIGALTGVAALCFVAYAQDGTPQEEEPTVTGQEFVSLFNGENLDELHGGLLQTFAGRVEGGQQ